MTTYKIKSIALKLHSNLIVHYLVMRGFQRLVNDVQLRSQIIRYELGQLKHLVKSGDRS